MPGGHTDLVSHLARIADPEHPRRQAGNATGAPGHERKGRRGHVDIVDQSGEDLPGTGSRKRYGRELLGDRGQIHVEVGPLRLQPVLQPGQHASRIARGRGHQEPVR